MKVFSVVGFSDSGKTHTVENIIKELKKRGFSVGSVKEIHCDSFTMEEKGTDTHRHKKAGADLVTARGKLETNILFQEKLPIKEILKNYSQDFVVLEGVEETGIPRIITAHDKEGILAKLDPLAFAISGRISKSIDEFEGLPAINDRANIKELVDLIEKKARWY